MVQGKIEFIKEQICKSGFPLEMDTSLLLRKRNCQVYNNVYFFDDDAQKEREFDIMAFLSPNKVTPSDFDRRNYWFLSPTFLVECKKSSSYSWVFFRSQPDLLPLNMGHSIDVLTEKFGYVDSVASKIMITSPNILHYTEGPIVSAYQEVKLTKLGKNARDDKDAILNAISKIVKFVNYRFHELKDFFTKDPPRKDVVFFFPLIVFEGELYEASFEKTLELKESRHLIYETSYLSKLVKSLVPLYIDIVRKDALEEMVSIIEEEVYNINEFLRKRESQKRISSLLPVRI